jgi:hypothetical protein
MQIESYRTRLEDFEQSLNRELFRYYSGLKEQLELTSVYADHSDFLSLDSVREIKSELENTADSFSSRRKSLKKLHEFLVDQHLDLRAASTIQEMARFKAQQSVSWGATQIALSQFPSLMRSEPGAERRRKLSETYARALSDSEGFIREEMVLLRSATAALGFNNYIQVREYVSGLDYAGLLNAVDDALGRLEDQYLERLRASVEATLGISLQDAGAWDAARWQVQNDAPQVFSEKNLLPLLEATISELGIWPERPDSISVDLSPGPQKPARPFCIPIRVPQEIKIVLRPESGSRQYAALFHESGHAHHFAWTSPSLPVEHRVWGDRTISEAYAFLFEHLLLDSEWLSRMLSYTKSGEFLRFQALYRVFLVRQCAGRLRLALHLWREETLDDIPQAYAEIMKTYTGLRHQPELWLVDYSNGFDAACYLRGWILESMLREYIYQRYGKSWFRNRSAAGFLKEIWETGHLYNAEELSREIGIGNLEPQVLADELLGGLQY